MSSTTEISNASESASSGTAYTSPINEEMAKPQPHASCPVQPGGSTAHVSTLFTLSLINSTEKQEEAPVQKNLITEEDAANILVSIYRRFARADSETTEFEPPEQARTPFEAVRAAVPQQRGAEPARSANRTVHISTPFARSLLRSTAKLKETRVRTKQISEEEATITTLRLLRARMQRMNAELDRRDGRKQVVQIRVLDSIFETT